MHMQLDVNTSIEIKKLTDLPKLKLLMEGLNMTINVSSLAKELGSDRRTVKKYLNGFRPKKSRDRRSKIDAFYNEIKYLLSDETPQKFYYKRILWQYLKDNHGLDCSESGFRAYISRKPEFQQYFDSDRARDTQTEVVRYETPPAEQAQLDWKEDITYITKDGEKIQVNVCVLLLGYSRFRTYLLSISKSQSVLLSFLAESFEAIGGVPKTLLVDNMKTVMDDARTKYKEEKVEAPMKLLDEIHAYQGKFNYEELHEFIQQLCDRINHDYHKGTGEIPIFHLKKEKSLLSPLPSKRIRDYYKINHILVKVNTSNMFSYKSNMYSVPAGYIGKTVGLQVYDNQIHVYYSTDLLVVHTISQQKLNYQMEHYVEAMARKLPYSDNIDDLALKNLAAINEVYQNE